MSTVINAGINNYRFDVLPMNQSTEDWTSSPSCDDNEFFLDADEIASRLAEIKSKWSASERIVRGMIGRARRDRLAATLLKCKAA